MPVPVLVCRPRVDQLWTSCTALHGSVRGRVCPPSATMLNL
jgi:hypothetical protein